MVICDSLLFSVCMFPFLAGECCRACAVLACNAEGQPRQRQQISALQLEAPYLGRIGDGEPEGAIGSKRESLQDATLWALDEVDHAVARDAPNPGGILRACGGVQREPEIAIRPGGHARERAVQTIRR